MADTSHPFDARRRRPRDWGEAFTYLPMETPPLSVWSRLAERLDGDVNSTAEAMPAHSVSLPASTLSPRSTRGARSMRGWLAVAASLSALALVPLFWPGKREGSHDTHLTHRSTPANGETARRDTARATASKAHDSASTGDAAPRISATISQAATAAAPRIDFTQTPASADDTMRLDRITLESAPQIASTATVRATIPTTMLQRAIQAPDPIDIVGVVASTDAETPALPASAVLISEADAHTTPREMEMLYSASAQLETLLAYTRDPRVETGPAAALSSEIHTRLVKIDAQLAQPELSPHQQYALWLARVGTLRQAVAVESELRALSAEGQGYEGQLVEVY